MEKTVFEVSKMDCPSEENMIRMKLDGVSQVKGLDFDIPGRKLTVYHAGGGDVIEGRIGELNLGSKRLGTEQAEESELVEQASQRSLLWAVLAINFSFFVLEMVYGLISESMGLVADSLDMLADALVYGISLFAVGSTVMRKKRIATLAGYLQLVLAAVGFIEVLRRFIGSEELPDFSTMIIVSSLALLANALCLYLLQTSKSKEAHMQASMIFTSNDVMINAGVILAGVLVKWLDSGLPDLVIGAVVFALVTQGATRILRLGK